MFDGDKRDEDGIPEKITLDESWHQSIQNVHVGNLGVRREVHDFIQGFPDFQVEPKAICACMCAHYLSLNT